MTVEFRYWENGDWVEVHVNGILYYQGHSVPDHVFCNLLQKLGADVRVVTGITEE